MDWGTISGLVALAMSGASLWLGLRSDNATRRRIEDFTKTNERLSEQNERQSGQIEALIGQLGAATKQSNKLIEVVKLLINRI